MRDNENARTRIPRGVTDRLVEAQNYRCIYCQLKFGTVVSRPGRQGFIIQNAQGDHFRPKAAGGGKTEANAVAACQICNGIKGSTIFVSIEEATRYILQRRSDKGIIIEMVPTMATQEDPAQWAKEISQFFRGEWLDG